MSHISEISMDRTPKLTRSLSRHNIYSPGTSEDSQLCPTSAFDIKMYAEMENDDSPVHIACTQEGCDNVDVVWDWNSPQAKQRPKRPHKRLILPQSPKVPVKRYPSNNQIQNFEKLREELQALREAIALPDHEDSLVLSPREEAEYKDVADGENTNNVPPLTQEICLEGNYADLFNDSADEDLVLCTQKIEADLEAIEKNRNRCSDNLINNPDRDTKVRHINKDIKNLGFNNSSFQLTKNINMDTGNSLVNSSKKIDSEQQEVNNIIDNKISYNHSLKTSTRLDFPTMRYENQYKNCTQAGKVEFHRTQSFESTIEYKKEVIPQHKLDEIERKRKEALAKLELKRKQEYSGSPSKCSPEEIEKKRLQARAKLEVKRQQETIERKRQEALKRLELSRKKNAVVVRSSLSTRL